MSVYENVVEYATKRDLSIAELEKRAGLGNGTIGKWKTSKPTIDTLEKVANVLKVKIGTLMKG